jgi:copper resistance protein C
MRICILIVAMVLAAFGNIAGADAHAFLDHASPLVGSTVSSAPRELALTFTQNLEAAFSSVQVTDANGGRVDSGKPQISGNTMRVGLKSLPQGTYRVRWQVLSVDTHKTEGSFTFRVGGQ